MRLIGPLLFAPILIGISLPSAFAAGGVRTTHALSLELAQKIALDTVEQCRSMGFHVSTTVIDSAGLTKAFLRDEGTGPHTIGLSRAKAYTALTLASRYATSGEFATKMNSTGGSPMTNIEGVVGVAGGVPIKYQGEVIGAVGTSGAVGGDKDEICSQAAVAKVAEEFK